MLKLHKKRGTEEMSGQDSFLDIISNIVGILIILVMIAGIRAQGASVSVDESIQADFKPAQEDRIREIEDKFHETQEKGERALRMRDSIDETVEQAQKLALQLDFQAMEYARLFDLLTAGRAEVEAMAEAKDNETREKIELQRQIQEIDAKLAQLDRTRNWIQANRPKATVLENIPTPISKTVEDKEAHFQLLGGKIAYIPIPELMESLGVEYQSNKKHYDRQQINTGRVGPINDFVAEFVISTYDRMVHSAYGSGVGRATEIEYVNFVPVRDSVGQPLREALASPNSDLVRRLSVYRQDLYTITLWVYPDSFEEFRELKQLLYSKGYQVAARPLEHGTSISASARGTKSSSQ